MAGVFMQTVLRVTLVGFACGLLPAAILTEDTVRGFAVRCAWSLAVYFGIVLAAFGARLLWLGGL